MKIFRYSEKLRKILSADTKAEPWLHIMFVSYKEIDDRAGAFFIYVWDTREVVEYGSLDGVDTRLITGKPAYDNHEPLKGHFDGIDLINSIMKKSVKRK